MMVAHHQGLSVVYESWYPTQLSSLPKSNLDQQVKQTELHVLKQNWKIKLEYRHTETL
jgi:hypothetical protein